LPARRLIGASLGAALLATSVGGCGGSGTGSELPPPAVQRSVVERFAAALLHGDTAGARALLVPDKDGVLTFLVRKAVSPAKARRTSISPPTRRTGDRWAVRFVSRRTYADLRFETQRGDLVVFLAPSPAGAAVRFFTFTNVRTRFSTHHDAQLLPSNR
jgi:hypothetical protein